MESEQENRNEVEIASESVKEVSSDTATDGEGMAGEQRDEGQRLMIKSMALENFKSYAGKKVIGPFHKCFSSIVGPNGSGKSNVIDAMLFVFGKRAKKLRLNKVRELIHNSTDFPNCEHAKVTVFFHDIIDTDEGDNGYTVVPGSEFQVSRVAYKSNKSEYLINGKKSNFTEVGKLLRKRGVDLDNNRFLILQGEVEQISLMKPKAQNQHEDGLLEYLEDIIGSNKFVEAIEEGSKKVESLSDERAERLNLVKIVEKEKDDLEDMKSEAEAYLAKQLSVLRARNKLCQLNLAESSSNLTKLEENKTVFEEKKEYEEKKKQSESDRLKIVKKEFDQMNSETKKLEEQLKKVEEEFAAFERKDISYRENVKFNEKAIKKLEKTLKGENEKLVKHRRDEEQLRASIPDHELNISNVEKEKAHHEKLLDELFQSFQGEAEAIRKKIEVEQAKLAPLIEVTTECRGSVGVTQTEIQLIEDTVANAVEQHKSLTAQLTEITTKLRKGPMELEGMQAELTKARKRFEVVQTEIEQCSTMERDVAMRLRDTRSQLESAKASVASMSSRGTMLNSLAKASSKGGALENATLAGRLGDLGSIDDKYDVAVSTACGALNFLVTETTKGAEKCVSFLRKNNLGRNTFIILDKLKHLEKKMNSCPKTPEGVPRLFDLVSFADPKYKTAFYFGLRDTLVAKDLDQAVRIAYEGNRCVWRVVTLQGQLIDTSGTMSGGGNNVKRGGMSSTLGSSLQANGNGAKEVAELGVEAERLSQELQIIRDEARKLQGEEKALSSRIDSLEVDISKLKLDLENIQGQELQIRDRISELSGKLELTPANAAKLAELKKVLAQKTEKLEEAESKSSKVEKKIEAMQQQINELGGDQVKSQKTKAKQASDALDLANSQLNKAISKIKNANRGMKKAEECIAKTTRELEEKKQELAQTEAEFKSIEDDAKEVQKLHKSEQSKVEEKKEKLQELKEEYNELQSTVKTIEKVLADIKHQLNEHNDKIEDCRLKVVKWTKKLETVRKEFKEVLEDISAKPESDKQVAEVTTTNESNSEMEVDGQQEEESAKNEEDTDPSEGPLREYSEDELKSIVLDDLKVEITLLEGEIDDLKKNVNIAAIAQYRERERVYITRVKELDDATTSRDKARSEVENLRKQRLDSFMAGFSVITLKLKEMYQMITLGGDAELELVDSLDPFSEGIVFSVRPPKKSWKNISNLSGGEKTLSSLALVFALHHYKPTPLYVMDEIDAALDYKNVSIVANYIKERTKNAQFVIISLRNNMFELADRLVGIYKTNNATKTIAINPAKIVEQAKKHQEAIAAKKYSDNEVQDNRKPLSDMN